MTAALADVEILPALPTDHASLDRLRVRVMPGADQGVAAAYLATLRTPQSRRSMTGALEALALLLSAGATSDPSWIAWHELRNAHVQAVATTLADRHAPSTANHRLAALRGCLKAAWRAGLLDAESYHRGVDVRPITGTRLPAGRALGVGELRALFASCASDPSPAGARDAAVLALLVGAGLRRTEASELDLADLDLEAGAVRVMGKGRKQRQVPVENGALEALRDWVAIRGTEPGPLLVALSRGRALTLERISGDGLLRLCQRRAERAGVAAFGCHDLRRSFASGALDAGVDLPALQGLMGHSSVTTTARYDRRGERAMRKAAGLLHIPYAGRTRAN